MRMLYLRESAQPIRLKADCYNACTKKLFCLHGERGYKEIWLVDAPSGHVGALLCERQYPGDAVGLVLLAFFS